MIERPQPDELALRCDEVGWVSFSCHKTARSVLCRALDHRFPVCFQIHVYVYIVFWHGSIYMQFSRTR